MQKFVLEWDNLTVSVTIMAHDATRSTFIIIFVQRILKYEWDEELDYIDLSNT